MQIENHKEQVPFEHYCKEWAELDPAETAKKSRVPFDPETGTFSITMLGVGYRLHWPEFSIEADGGEGFALTNIPAQILLMRRVMSPGPAPSLGRFLTFRETPWGDVYVRQFTGRCLNRAAFTFGTKTEAFRKALGRIGAEPLTHGDVSGEVEFLPELRMRIILWEGDDEFPPSSQILFSDNFPSTFAAEDLVVCADVLISALKTFI